MKAFEKLMTGLSLIDDQFELLKETYSDDMSSYELHVLSLKASILAFESLILSNKCIKNSKIEKDLYYLKGLLTCVCGSTIVPCLFMAPPITPFAIIGTVFLSFKRNKDFNNSEDLLSEEEYIEFADIIEEAGLKYAGFIEKVENKVEELNNEEAIYSITNREEFINRLASKLLCDSLVTKELNIDDSDILESIVSILKKTHGLSTEDIYSLISESLHISKSLELEFIEQNKLVRKTSKFLKESKKN